MKDRDWTPELEALSPLQLDALGALLNRHRAPAGLPSTIDGDAILAKVRTLTDAEAEAVIAGGGHSLAPLGDGGRLFAEAIGATWTPDGIFGELNRAPARATPAAPRRLPDEEDAAPPLTIPEPAATLGGRQTAVEVPEDSRIHRRRSSGTSSLIQLAGELERHWIGGE